MYWVVLLVIGYAIYCALPFWVEIILVIINMGIPDTIPFIDEFLMILPVVKKIHTVFVVKRLFEEHPVVKYLILIALIAVVAGVIYMIFR